MFTGAHVPTQLGVVVMWETLIPGGKSRFRRTVPLLMGRTVPLSGFLKIHLTIAAILSDKRHLMHFRATPQKMLNPAFEQPAG